MDDTGLRSRQIAAIALGIGLFFTAQTALMAFSRGHVSLEWDVAQELLYWVVWALLAPVILAAVRRWPLHAHPRAGAIAAHSAVAIVLAGIQTTIAFGLHFLVLRLTGAVTSSELAAWIVRLRPGLVWGAFMGALLYAVVIAVDAGIRVRRLYTAARLDVLQSQLRPHFIFNALNAISVLAVEKPEAARRMTIQLGAILRRSFEENDREVPLEREMAFLNEYLAIQRTRFGDRLSVSIHVADDVHAAAVPSFLLQPLVENAMEHAVAVREQPTVVKLRAWRVDGRLRITIEDNGPGPSEGALLEGTGLRHARELLARLYGPASRVALVGAGDDSVGGARAEVELPYTATRR